MGQFFFPSEFSRQILFLDRISLGIIPPSWASNGRVLTHSIQRLPPAYASVAVTCGRHVPEAAAAGLHPQENYG